jgi:hypothetical protein
VTERITFDLGLLGRELDLVRMQALVGQEMPFRWDDQEMPALVIAVTSEDDRMKVTVEIDGELGWLTRLDDGDYEQPVAALTASTASCSGACTSAATSDSSSAAVTAGAGVAATTTGSASEEQRASAGYAICSSIRTASSTARKRDDKRHKPSIVRRDVAALTRSG